MKCTYCAEFNASAPWATLKSRKFEADNFVDHERSTHHIKAMLRRSNTVDESTPLQGQLYNSSSVGSLNHNSNSSVDEQRNNSTNSSSSNNSNNNTVKPSGSASSQPLQHPFTSTQLQHAMLPHFNSRGPIPLSNSMNFDSRR